MNQAPTKANTIVLVLTFHWFDKIFSKRKKNEYRIVDKWFKKLNLKIHAFWYETDNLYLDLRRGYTNNFVLYQVKYVTLDKGTETDLKTDKLVYNFELDKLIDTNIKK